MDKLFSDIDDQAVSGSTENKGDAQLDSISELKKKLALVIDKVKSLKQEKNNLEARVRELEGLLAQKEDELRSVSSDKLSIKDQITDLLNELETIETS